MSIIGLVVFIGLFFVGILSALPFGIFSIYNAVTKQQFDAGFFSSIGAIALIFVIFLILSFIVAYAIQAANILIVGSKGKVKIGTIFRKGFSYVLPLFLAGLFTGFIIAGGYFLFIIPGIFFALLFVFTFFEIVLNNQGVLSAMRRSSRIVLANFWGVFGRILLWIVVLFALMLIPQIIVSSSKSSALSGIWTIVSSVLNVLISWYGLCYMVTLYKQASKGFESDKGNKILWPVLTAIVGWIVGILLIIAVFTFVSFIIQSIMKQQANLKNDNNINIRSKILTPEQIKLNKAVQNAVQNPTEENVRKILKLVPTSSPEYIEFEKQIKKTFPAR